MPCHSPPSFHLASTPAPPKPHSRLDLLKFNLALCCPRILPFRIIPGSPPLPSRTPSPRFPQLITAPFEPFAPLPDPRISLSEPARLTATAAYPVSSPRQDSQSNPVAARQLHQLPARIFLCICTAKCIAAPLPPGIGQRTAITLRDVAWISCRNRQFDLEPRACCQKPLSTRTGPESRARPPTSCRQHSTT